jgi:hypothetical protein
MLIARESFRLLWFSRRTNRGYNIFVVSTNKTTAAKISHPWFQRKIRRNPEFRPDPLELSWFHGTTRKKNALRIIPEDMLRRVFLGICPSAIKRPQVKSKEVEKIIRKRNLMSHQPKNI